MFLYPKLKSLVLFGLYMGFSTTYHFYDYPDYPSDTATGTLPSSSPTQFLSLLDNSNPKKTKMIIDRIASEWTGGYEIMVLETAYYSKSLDNSQKLINLLEEKTQQEYGSDFEQWFQWIWNRDAQYTPEYHSFKAALHKRIDPRFENYFLGRAQQSTIRLDEVRWGGVLQDGIPPLRNPKMIPASEAKYLRDSATVFGIAVNGDVRAYPKQVLAWHELFTDKIGGIQLAGVYCTLCGTVILYKTEDQGIHHQLGTSGFLYRSNKLMYDKATQSLWSTLEGKPVIGPLVGKGITLEYLSVVTTTWGEWKERHPNTQVLSLDTGFRRDYREGVAYQDYFATDKLMFSVPELDNRLKNKDEILAIRSPEVPEQNLAISSTFLQGHPIYQDKLGNLPFTVFTDTSGAHRVFKTGALHFNHYDGKSTAIDNTGVSWTIKENAMVSKQRRLDRLESHNAFWFGYQAAFPNVKLIQ
ncbi:MAG: DUF3179 domain-containing protein [Bacteroidota bacterium]